ncbi:ribosome biogenesis factor YjgA [Agarilytica rhodophyticola]|uniref:ribosome biogenesis factor YjgA n=1 Tax=Agarilytica rhodophyticola TaxID=1737490 RepID=UPI000B3494A9|nr:ribosome biogenesis factor YjgA [Agarilytica rhodophyticola]
MHIDSDHEPQEFEEEIKSKTQVKKEMLALHELGISISKLTREQQAKIPLDDKLREMIEQAPTIKSNSAKKRHMQYIGKLMRSEDIDAVSQAYESVIQQSHQAVQQHHTIERWRDVLIAGDNRDIQRYIESFPNTDRQQLRQLIRAAQKEIQQSKPPAHARKLFRFIRDNFSSDEQDS